MRLHRTITALAALLMVGSLGACAEYTTTGVPSEEEAGVEEATLVGEHPLESTAWVLTGSSLSSQDLGSMGITADFFKEQMSGQAPVNSYFADYTTEGESIEFGPIGSTLMAGDQKMMDAEAAYFELLGSVTTFAVTEEKLTLKSGGQEVLGYIPAGSATDVQGAAGGEQDVNALAGTLVGIAVAEAETATTDAGFVFRVVSVDGEPRPVTMDYREDRINAEVEDDTVVRVTIG